MGTRGLRCARPSSLHMGLVLVVVAALSLATPGVDAQANRRAREVGSRVPLRFAGGRDASLPSVAAISGTPLNQPIALNRNNPMAAAGPPVVFGPKIRRRPWRFWF
ncbi:uncharacterized protein LOC119573757 [Penaeus monodon]|uniref:uncharacterized protein LOC119573757 n=1 Tax=Penaeus monodon TaxID=6687 RepID=UPI0018A6EA19|nr:uncharacterized protein LOC119573757 [Penaeus monodon]XP_037776788.1 uncharacterized protein LOC119573757 [Penaeus monodon]